MVPKDSRLQAATVWNRGRLLEDFEIGQVIDHHWSKTFTAEESILFSNLTLHFTEQYFSLEAARAAGHRDIHINPWFVFLTVFGLSVEDLSEAGLGAFLGGEDVVFGENVYPGDTISCSSVVSDIRFSESRPGYGIVTWTTTGVNQRNEEVISYRRTNFVISQKGSSAS